MITALAAAKTFIPDPLPRELAARSTAGFGWNVAGGILRAAAGLAINTVLARLLGPEPFGKLALAMVVVSLGNLVAEAGMGTGLIQKLALDELDVRHAFTVQIAAGTGLGLLTFVLAPAIAAMLAQPAVAPLLRVMSFVVPLQAFGQTGAALLRRSLNFRRLQKLNIASYLVGYLALGIPLALGGYGVWSLIFAQLAQVCVQSAGAWMLSGHSLRLHWARSHGPSAGAGLSIGAGNVAAWAVSSLPALLIGRLQGVATLGLYSRAFFVVSTPASVLASGLQSATLTLHSRLRKYPRVSNHACLGMMALCQLVTVPAFFGVAAMPHTVIETLFGRSWAAAAPLLTPLAIAMPLECLAALSGPLLIARGRPGLEFWVQAATAISTLLAVGLLAARWPMPAAAWGVLFGVYLVRAIAATAATLRITGISWLKWASNLAPGALLGMLVFLLVSAMEGWLVAAGMPAWSRLLLLCSLAAAVTTGVALAAPERVLGREALRIVTSHISPRAARFLKRGEALAWN
jgi:O-antigen/teichoic acid export membrane protein